MGEFGAALLTAVINGKTPHALKLSQIVMAPQLTSRGGPQSDLMPLPLPELSRAEEEYAWKGAAAWRALEAALPELGGGGVVFEHGGVEIGETLGVRVVRVFPAPCPCRRVRGAGCVGRRR